MEYDQFQANALEQPISENLNIGDDSDSEEGDSSSNEWEAVSIIYSNYIVDVKLDIKLYHAFALNRRRRRLHFIYVTKYIYELPTISTFVLVDSH